MNKRLNSYYFIASGLLILSGVVFDASNAHARPSKQKKQEAVEPTEPNQLMPLIKNAYAEGRYSDFSRLTAKMPANHAFTPYTEIWQFRFFQKGQEKQLPDNEVVWKLSDIEPVLTKHAGSWPAEQLRRDWVQQLARSGQWDLFQQQRQKLRYRPDQGVECADLIYASTQGQLPQYKINNVIGADKKLPKTCRFLLKTLYNKNTIRGEDLDRHVLNLVAEKQFGPAKQFVDDMADTAWGRNLDSNTLDNALEKPDRAIKSPPSGSDLYLAAALTRKAVEDYEYTASLIRYNFKNDLSKNSEKWLWGHIGYRAGLVWDTKASEYFKQSTPEVLNPEQQEWKVRAALLREDWPAVLDTINDMAQNLKENRTWQYWRGRALAATGKMVEARQEWIRAANNFSFYGKLSNEELGNSITAPKKPAPLTSEENNWAKKNPALIRTLALYDAGMRTEGLWEFNLQVAQMNDRELLATAAWAERNKLYDRAIAAPDRTELEHDLSMRYLTPFREQMRVKAAEAGVDESWVYGLIRQESRFMTIARSAVGASGLMQVMPATADYVAKKIGLGPLKKKDLTEVETNLTLGTNYLKIVLDQHGQSPVLASASYNAGPGRPTLWKRRLGENREVEGAIFTELIPFDETRDYVKNVMSNTVAYSLVLNNSTTSLKQRLGLIRGTN